MLLPVTYPSIYFPSTGHPLVTYYIPGYLPLPLDSHLDIYQYTRESLGLLVQGGTARERVGYQEVVRY